MRLISYLDLIAISDDEWYCFVLDISATVYWNDWLPWEEKESEDLNKNKELQESIGQMKILYDFI